jgi:DNA-binding XRE family transcriptional regulator
MAVEFIQIGNERIAVMPAAEYQRLVEQAEEQADVQAAMDAEMRRHDGEEYLPAEMVDRILAGEAPLRVWRKHRRLTLQALSKKVGISFVYLSQIEKGKREGTLKVWRQLASALNLDLDDILPQSAE